MKYSLVKTNGMVHWDQHAEKLLDHPETDEMRKKRQEIARKHGLAAVFFTSDEILEQVRHHAESEVQTGRAHRAKHVKVLSGGEPFHNDKVALMREIDPSLNPKTDRIRTSAYDGPKYVGAHIVDDFDSKPQTLQEGDEVVLDDDGIDTAGSLIICAEALSEKYGINNISAVTALTKQPGMIISGFANTTSLFSTPYGVWGEGYGFDNSGINRDIRVIGMSMRQPFETMEVVEYTLEKLGGVDGFAIASIDQIVQYNKQFKS